MNLRNGVTCPKFEINPSTGLRHETNQFPFELEQNILSCLMVVLLSVFYKSRIYITKVCIVRDKSILLYLFLHEITLNIRNSLLVADEWPSSHCDALHVTPQNSVISR